MTTISKYSEAIDKGGGFWFLPTVHVYPDGQVTYACKIYLNGRWEGPMSGFDTAAEALASAEERLSRYRSSEDDCVDFFTRLKK